MDLAQLIGRQRAYFHTGATRPLGYRRAQLQKLHDALVTHETVLLAALQADLRKSTYEAYTTELGLVLSEVRHALRCLPAWMRPQRRPTPLLAWPARGFIQPEPYGVALIMGPWNYPLQLLLSPLVGALAAGNCVVLKPSEFAPRTVATIAQLIGATFAEEYVAVVQGERDVAEALLRERFDSIFFTGSTKVGRAVMTAAARHLTPITLELGGKCPCLVCADAPLDITARRIVWGKFMNAGQTCVAPDFVLADRRVRVSLVEAMKRAIRQFYGDDPQKSEDYGRIVNRKHLDRLTSYLAGTFDSRAAADVSRRHNGRQQNAPTDVGGYKLSAGRTERETRGPATGRIVHGGQHDASDLYLAPTILTGVAADAPVMREEIFGPILPVLEFDKLDDALALLHDRPTPLALYLFTKDRATQERVLTATRSGGVCLNDTITHMIGKDLPFGGLGESGLGAYHGQASFDCFTHRRSVLRRSLAFDPKLRYPPPRISLATLKRAYRFLLGG
jgi:aldehyde dehydrogenase (NAD+)